MSIVYNTHCENCTRTLQPLSNGRGAFFFPFFFFPFPFLSLFSFPLTPVALVEAAEQS